MNRPGSRATAVLATWLLAIALHASDAVLTGQERPLHADPEVDVLLRVQRLTGSTPEECGRHMQGHSWAQPGHPIDALQRSVHCIIEASEAHRSAWVLEKTLGFDSWVASGLLVAADGVIQHFSFDYGMGAAVLRVTACGVPNVVQTDGSGRGFISCSNVKQHDHADGAG